MRKELETIRHDHERVTSELRYAAQAREKAALKVRACGSREKDRQLRLSEYTHDQALQGAQQVEATLC
jgi:hypothetical protein